MEKRFSSEELYRIRNEIALEFVLSELGEECKYSEGYMRFICPCCKEGSKTAINKTTNLGRCFRCSKNFNTLEMVMAVKGDSFVASVKFLKSYITPLKPFDCQVTFSAQP